MIDLSIVIPVYNGSALLERCLDSILAQKTDYSMEVWLVDDGSTDNTVSLYQSKYQKGGAGLSDHPVQFHLLQQKNAGPSKARNWGMRQSQGRFLALLDADDYWEDSYVQQTVSFLEMHQECVAVSVVCKNISVSGISYTPPVLLDPEYVEREKSRNVVKKNEPLHNKNANAPFIIDDFYSYWAKLCHVGTCSTTMRSEDAVEVQMREDLRISEDYEFWLSLSSRGKWGMIPQALYVSDGTSAIVTQKDWIARMQKRWNNAPTLEEWERRIVAQSPELRHNHSFQLVEGRVARNLVYCQLLSGRIKLARQEALRYGRYFVQDAIGQGMNLCKYTFITWWIFCKFLSYRENHRFE